MGNLMAVDSGESGPLHERQHDLIAERIQAIASESGRRRQRQAGQRAGVTMVGHLRRFHGWTGNSAGVRLNDLVEIHEAEHSGGEAR